MKKNIIISLCLYLGAFTTLYAESTTYKTTPSDIIPQPIQAITKEGSFRFTPETAFGVENSEQLRVVEIFTQLFATPAGFIPPVKIGTENSSIALHTDKSMNVDEYNLDISPTRITIKANSTSGFFYALQSIRQMLPHAINGKIYTPFEDWSVPAVTITDYPRFEYRGLMLDVARYFIPKSTVLKIIDAAALLKINRLHMHLVDDNGWRLEIKKYPKLMQTSAWRVDRDAPFSARKNPLPGEPTPVGGYYSQEEMKDIINYATARQMEVIPEIEMPAHTVSSLAAYPNLTCQTRPDKFIGVLPGMGGDTAAVIYCAGNDSVFHFLEDVIDEVIDIFPGKYIHLGGDEASKTNWAKCPKCLARLKAEHLNDIEDLQGYFMNRMSKYVRNKGKEVMGWDELTNSKLPEESIIFGWQGLGTVAMKAAEQGHRFVMTPAKIMYLIRYQGPQWFEPLTYFGNNTLKDVYNYEPVQSDWKPEYEKLLMGVQASLWTEFCNNPEDAEYLIFPRLLALSEVGWRQKDKKDWLGFLKRADKFLPNLDAMNIIYAHSMYNLDHKITPEKGTLNVEMSCIRPDVEIRYTTDGTTPNSKSELYSIPLKVNQKSIISATTFANDKMLGKILKLDINWNQATAQKVLTTNNDKPYVLTNGLRGSDRHSDSEWAGWYEHGASFTVDLKTKKEINTVKLGSITNWGMGVFKPSVIKLYCSDNNKKKTLVKEIRYTPSQIFIEKTATEDIIFESLGIKSRYLTFEFENPGKCPVGTTREGQNTWVYFDEIIAE